MILPDIFIRDISAPVAYLNGRIPSDPEDFLIFGRNIINTNIAVSKIVIISLNLVFQVNNTLFIALFIMSLLLLFCENLKI